MGRTKVDLQLVSVGRESSPWRCGLHLRSSLLDGKSLTPSRRKEPGWERVGGGEEWKNEEACICNMYIYSHSSCFVLKYID